jgi:hypothetical protein
VQTDDSKSRQRQLLGFSEYERRLECQGVKNRQCNRS